MAMEAMTMAMAMVLAIIVILIAPATTITIMDIPIEITIPVTGVTVIMDQGLDPVIGDKIIGQGGRKIF
jgi:hypothetical protein